MAFKIIWQLWCTSYALFEHGLEKNSHSQDHFSQVFLLSERCPDDSSYWGSESLFAIFDILGQKKKKIY